MLSNLLRLLVCIFFLGLQGIVYSNVAAQSIDQQLAVQYRHLAATIFDDPQHDSNMLAFKAEMMQQLGAADAFQNPFDSLQQEMGIVTSPDGKVRFFNWDCLGGGVRHSVNSLAQFVGENGKVQVQELSDESAANFTDSGIFEVYAYTYKAQDYYLTFAAGSYGGGMRHYVVQIFYLEGDSLQRCEACLDGKSVLPIEFPRIYEAKLRYDPEREKLSFDEFRMKDDWLQPTHRQMHLKLKNGVFVNRSRK